MCAPDSCSARLDQSERFLQQRLLDRQPWQEPDHVAVEATRADQDPESRGSVYDGADQCCAPGVRSRAELLIEGPGDKN